MSDTASQDAPPAAPAASGSLRRRLRTAWDLEFAQLRWRFLVFPLLARLLPAGRATTLRSSLVRAVGVTVGAGTTFADMPKLQSQPRGSLKRRLVIGRDCRIGAGVILEFGEVLTVGDRVAIADRAVVLTTTHELGTREHRAGTEVLRPVVIGNDVQIGRDAVVLPGVTVGDGARVLPGSVVNSNVAPSATVGGIPARPVREPATQA